MKAGPLIAFLVLGGAAIYILWKMRGGSARPAAATSAGMTNGYTTPVVTGTGPTGGYDHLQAQVDALSLTVAKTGTLTGTAAGTAVGSTSGAAVGATISSGEQAAARTLGAGTLTDAQIANLERNSATSGLALGATGGANVAGVGGGAVGGFLGNLFPSFGKAAAVPLADATPAGRNGSKSLYDVPFLGGIYGASDALFGGRP